MQRCRELGGREPSRERPSRIRALLCATLSAPVFLSAGCSRAPSFNILGSFFPSWILCGLIGTLLTTAIRFLLVRMKLEEQLMPLILVYPCMAAFFTFSIWLVFFS